MRSLLADPKIANRMGAAGYAYATNLKYSPSVIRGIREVAFQKG
jgi:hypothetical protein